MIGRQAFQHEFVCVEVGLSWLIEGRSVISSLLVLVGEVQAYHLPYVVSSQVPEADDRPEEASNDVSVGVSVSSSPHDSF